MYAASQHNYCNKLLYDLYWLSFLVFLISKHDGWCIIIRQHALWTCWKIKCYFWWFWTLRPNDRGMHTFRKNFICQIGKHSTYNSSYDSNLVSSAIYYTWYDESACIKRLKNNRAICKTDESYNKRFIAFVIEGWEKHQWLLLQICKSIITDNLVYYFCYCMGWKYIIIHIDMFIIITYFWVIP